MSNNTLFVLGAAVVGIVSAAGLFIVEHFRQERRRHAVVQDLARLDRQLSGMQKELEQLRLLQSERRSVKSKRLRKEASRSVSTASNYTVEVDSSDLEFYDLSDEEESTLSLATPLEQMLKDVDEHLNVTDSSVVSKALDSLLNAKSEYPLDVRILWRLGKAYHKMSSNADAILKQEYIDKGIQHCQMALDVDSNIADAHKWYAILIGVRSGYQSIQGKISDGYLFKQHIDAAIAITPTDATLHHMLGRFTYETANLKWYERKVAATFFAEPPSGTFDEALAHFVQAERLLGRDWKENKLSIAKCQIALGHYQQAVQSLRAADAMLNDSLDATIDTEVKVLLQKYNAYS